MARAKAKKIVEAETTPVENEVVEAQNEQPGFDMDNVAEMVMVGRYKDGKEFVIPVNLDDVLKAKAYCEYGSTKFQILIERHVFNEIVAKEKQG